MNKPKSTEGVKNLDKEGREAVIACVHALHKDADDLLRTLGAIDYEVAQMLDCAADDDLSPVLCEHRAKLEQLTNDADAELQSLNSAFQSLSEYHDNWPKC